MNFAEQQFQQCVDFALMLREQRNPQAAMVMLDKADWWQRIAAQSPDEREPREHISHLVALEAAGILLTRAKQGSNEAAGYLGELMQTIASNLCSLVVHEKQLPRLKLLPLW